MHISKTPSIILGILTFLPFLGMLGILALIFFEIMVLLFSETPVNPLLYLSYINYVLPVIAGYLLIYLGLGIFYLVHIIQNQFLDKEKKLLWVVVLITLNGLSMLFYWYIYLWKKSGVQDHLKANAW